MSPPRINWPTSSALAAPTPTTDAWNSTPAENDTASLRRNGRARVPSRRSTARAGRGAAAFAVEAAGASAASAASPVAAVAGASRSASASASPAWAWAAMSRE